MKGKWYVLHRMSWIVSHIPTSLPPGAEHNTANEKGKALTEQQVGVEQRLPVQKDGRQVHPGQHWNGLRGEGQLVQLHHGVDALAAVVPLRFDPVPVQIIYSAQGERVVRAYTGRTTHKDRSRCVAAHLRRRSCGCPKGPAASAQVDCLRRWPRKLLCAGERSARRPSRTRCRRW